MSERWAHDDLALELARAWRGTALRCRAFLRELAWGDPGQSEYLRSATTIEAVLSLVRSDLATNSREMRELLR